MHRGRAARVLAVATTAVVLAGCTASSPGQDGATPSASPSPGDEASRVEVPREPGERVAVVIPPVSLVAGAEADALERAARELAADPPQGVGEVRVTRASSLAFVRDLAELAADDDYDVVCVVGTGSAEVVLELARARRDTLFCTTDGRVEGGPVNLVGVAVDPSALVEAGAVAIGTAEAPVGFLASPQLGDVEELTETFTAAVAPPRQETSPSPQAGDTGAEDATATAPEATGSPSPPVPASPRPAFVTVEAGAGTTSQANAADELAAGRPSRALVLATPGGAAAAAAAAATGTELVVVADWVIDAEGEQPPDLLVGLTIDWGALLRGAIESARDPDTSQVQLLGVDAAVLGARAGPVAGGGAAADRTNEHLRRSAE